MTTKENQIALHPAADVFRNHLLSEVREENNKLKGAIGRVQPVSDFLGRIEFHLGSDSHRIVSATLRQTFIANNVNGLPCLCVPIDNTPRLLSDFGTGRVSMSGQNIGNFPGVADPILAIGESGSIHMRIIISEHSVVEGELQGLSLEDFLHFKSGTFGDEQMMRFLTTGRGLQNPNGIAFVPGMIFMIATKDLRETIRVLGPLQKFKSEDGICCFESFSVDPIDFIECPPQSTSDASRLAIIASLGGFTDRQMALLNENRDLKTLSYQLSNIEERIRKVEIFNTVEKTCFSLDNGGSGDGMDVSPVWRYSLRKRGEETPIVSANNLHFLEIVVSGIRSDLKIMEIYATLNEDGTRTKFFSGTFCNGAQLFGVFDSNSAPGMNTVGFEELARAFLSGEGLFPPAFTLVLTQIYFPLDLVKNALYVLRVEA